MMTTNGSGGERDDETRGHEPRLIPDRMGRRQVSFEALAERLEDEFIAEYAETEALAQAKTATERLKLINATMDYVLAIESMLLAPADRAALIERVYSALFGYGPLDAHLLDPRVTTIALDGIERASVRYGHGDLVPLGPIFQSEGHLRRVLRRMLLDAGTDLYDDQPIVETGLLIDGRPVCVNLVAPPLTTAYTVDMRVHPAVPVTLDALIETDFITDEAADMLRRLAESAHGMVIVGDTESGKTTLLGALAQLVPEPARMVSVERAGELRLPPEAQRLVTRWRSGDDRGATFGEQIGAALALSPGCMLLDEVRADEPEAIAPLLAQPNAPRQVWSFRGPFDSKRLRSALTMLARRSDMAQGEAQVTALYRRLPFVVTVWRSGGMIRLYSVAEWQFRHSEDYPDYVPLLQMQDGELRATGEQPALPLG